MITRIRLKNWRSLQQVDINQITPLTVFIGENSSGKTNLLDALYFLRDATKDGVLQALFERGGIEKVRTIGADPGEPVELSFSFVPDPTSGELTYTLILKGQEGAFVEVDESLVDSQNQTWLHAVERDVQVRGIDGELHGAGADAPFGFEETVLSAYGRTPVYPRISAAFHFIMRRWQLLDENFLPQVTVPAGSSGDPYIIDQCADNVPLMLDFLKTVNPSEYEALQTNLKWLLGHVDKLDVESNNRETRFMIREEAHPEQEAPTISTGTERAVAILAALHALNLRTPESAGLVVIEEPDMSVHPLLLNRLVELMRSTVEGEHSRQVILTTHNPRLLDLLKPEEVRIVERTSQGYSVIKTVSPEIARIWLDEYGLGDVWMTRALGGVPD